MQMHKNLAAANFKYIPSSVAIMIEVTSCHLECSYFNLDYSQMLAIALHYNLKKIDGL